MFASYTKPRFQTVNCSFSLVLNVLCELNVWIVVMCLITKINEPHQVHLVHSVE
jgi:hypothetical protein